MNVLVINLTRFGDLLQTQPVLLGLKAQGHRVALLCLENFSSAAELLDGVDYIAALPGAALLARMDTDWRLALGLSEALCQDVVRDFAPQRIINTTATLSARLLARRIASACGIDEAILGFGMDAEGFGISGDIWATFLQGASSQRSNCPFNVVDMFRAASGVDTLVAQNRLREPDKTAIEAAQALLADCHPETTGFVALQLGASEERRQWPAAYFAALGDALWERLRLCPVLCGSPGERILAAEYAHKSRAPFIDTIGATNIPVLAALLRQTRLLVSNDTGTMHLAAGLGVPVLGIFLATAQPWDTGPYLAESCCLEPALDCHPCSFRHKCTQQYACRAYISADTVFALAHSYLTCGVWPELDGTKARIWRTVMDETGFANLTSLSGHEDREYTQWLRLQRIFYRHIIDRCNGKSCVIQEFSKDFSGILNAQEYAQTATALRQAASLLHLLVEQGTLAIRMGGGKAGTLMLATNERLYSLLSEYAPLATLGHLWRVLSQERGGHLDDFLRLASTLRDCVRAWSDAFEKSVKN